jgi:hypothetical protein
MDSRSLKEPDDAGSFGGRAACFETAAHGTCDAVLINLAYVYEPVTVLGAAVKPVFEEIRGLWKMVPKAPGNDKNEVSGLYRRIIYAQFSIPA